MHINSARERRRREMGYHDTYFQSTLKYKQECSECKTISISEAEKNSMIRRSKKGVVILKEADFIH